VTPVHHWKLGLFVVLGVMTACLAVVGLGANKLRREHEVFVTYFDESVQGLTVGSPVKFRGVQIGEVGEITVAEDRRHLVVQSRVDVAILERLGLHREQAENHPEGEPYVPEKIRAQIVPQGITGVRFLQIDYFEPKEHPLPKLPFKTPKNYIPAARSTLASIEEALVIAAEQVPILTAQIKRLLSKVEEILGEIKWKELSEDVRKALSEAQKLAKTLEAKLEPLDTARLQREAEAASKALRDVMADARALVERVEAKDGLLERSERTLASVEKEVAELKAGQTFRKVEDTLSKLDVAIASVDSTAKSLDSVSRNLEGLARDSRKVPAELSETLRNLDRAAREVRNLADVLQRDSDMLLKGRARK
jgi:phospholipid/cholesterol/gamma-HCH transport system substrate-binding protein